MIKTENVTINGMHYVRTWSDMGKMIERDGKMYEDALDPTHLGRTYTETEQDIPDVEAEESDYLKTLDRLGVTSDDEE